MPKPKRDRRPVTCADFVGAKMANFLWQLQHNKALTDAEREEAKTLCEQWAFVCIFPLNNPIIKAELEKALAAGEPK
jgi:predicted nucleic acid-binding protein